METSFLQEKKMKLPQQNKEVNYLPKQQAILAGMESLLKKMGTKFH